MEKPLEQWRALQGILPHLDLKGEGYPAEAAIEYSEEEGTASMSIRYGGDRFDPLAEGDELSSRLIRGIASETKYVYDAGNSLLIVI